MLPVLTITKTNEVQPSDCTSPLGSITIEASSSAPSARWISTSNGTMEHLPERFYRPTVRMLLPATSSTKSQSKDRQLHGIVVTDLTTGCTAEQQNFLPFLNSHKLTLIGQEDITNCVPGTGGSISVELEDITAGLTEANYDIFIFNAPEDPLSTTGTTIPSNGTPSQYKTTTPLNADYYTMVAVVNSSSPLPSLIGCRASDFDTY